MSVVYQDRSHFKVVIVNGLVHSNSTVQQVAIMKFLYCGCADPRVDGPFPSVQFLTL